MGYFPFFVDLTGKKCLVVGGGVVALRKVEKLVGFAPEIVVVAPEICSSLACRKGIQIIKRSFVDADVEDAFMVITATDQPALNQHIFQLCQARRIPVNAVDDIANCSFIFPALVHKEDITIGISTGGTSPVFARYLRERSEELLDYYRLEIASLLKTYRTVIKQLFSDEAQRKVAMDALLERCLSSTQLPDENEINQLLEALHEASYRNS